MQMADEVPKVLVQIVNEVPESFGGRWLMRFRSVLVQMADVVPENFGADSS